MNQVTYLNLYYETVIYLPCFLTVHSTDSVVWDVYYESELFPLPNTFEQVCLNTYTIIFLNVCVSW